MPSVGLSNRKEEHCAIALVNLGRRWPRPDGGWFRLLDYQVPLKARQSDARIGKIDLLGVTDRGRLMIVELKVPGRGGSRSDAPPAALMEGLRYAAIVEAELEAIAFQAEHRFGAKVARMPPIVHLLAPRAWWSSWLNLAPAGNWASALSRLVAAVETCTGISVECMALEHLKVAYSPDGKVPRLERIPALYPVRLNEAPSIGDTLGVLSSSAEALEVYLGKVRRTTWSWADHHHQGQLDGAGGMDGGRC